MKNSAVILQNLQIDYCSGGAMEVPKGDLVIPIANQLMDKFQHIIAAIDWHPAKHISFAGNHPWRHIGQTLTIDGLEQELLPFHCVQNSFGALFHPSLQKEQITHTIYQGIAANQDNYSCFFDADQRRDTQLDFFLKELKIENLFFLGLATENAIKHSVLDAINLGFQTYVVQDACKAWNKSVGAEKKAWKAIEKAGAIILNSERLLNKK